MREVGERDERAWNEIAYQTAHDRQAVIWQLLRVGGQPRFVSGNGPTLTIILCSFRKVFARSNPPQVPERAEQNGRE